MGRVLFITSFKGGVGKTTLSANLSAVLARMGYRVLAVDGDMGMRCMDMALGEENGAVYNVADVLEGKCTAERAIVQSGTVDGLFFLASPANRPEVIPEREKFLKLFALLREGYDYVIIDSSAEETPYYLSFAACADDAIVVCTHQSISVRAAEKTGLKLQTLGFRSVRMVVNCYRDDLSEAGLLMSVAKIIDGCAIRLLGVIPRDDSAVIDQENGVTAFGTRGKTASPYEAAIYNIACRVTGDNVPLLYRVLKPTKRKRYSRVKR